MKYQLVIQNGKIVTADAQYDADIGVLDGKIAAIGRFDVADGVEIYDAAGKHVLPGVIDAHVHFRDPGLTHKEDFGTGSLAAAFGGVTTVLDMPNVKPVTASGGQVRSKQEIAQAASYVDFGFYGLLLDDNTDEIGKMRDSGVVGYKIYLGTSVGDIAAPGDGEMLEQMRQVAALGMRVGFHAENNAVNDWYSAKCRMETNEASILPKARPDLSEADAVAAAIRLSENTGAAIHIYHVSSKKSVDLIRKAKANGVPVTAESCPQYLLLDAGDYPRLEAAMKAFPPVRYREDREALWTGVRDGTIDLIATDHAPHTPEEKSGDIWQAMAGVIGVETAVRLMLTQVNAGVITLQDYVRLSSQMPAKIWGLYPQKGSIQIGADADFTVIDLKKSDIIHNADLHSKHKNSIYDGVKTQGLPVATIVRGSVVMRDGTLTGGSGYGRMVTSFTAF